MCIHATAYYFCIVWFEIKFQIDLNLYSKFVWKISLENRKKFILPFSDFGPPQPSSACLPAWPPILRSGPVAA